MTEKPVPIEPYVVACEVCLAEIPLSVAISQEGNEYTQHFCGIECYSLWKEKQQKEPKAEE
jgi:hypothetical protein